MLLLRFAEDVPPRPDVELAELRPPEPLDAPFLEAVFADDPFEEPLERDDDFDADLELLPPRLPDEEPPLLAEPFEALLEAPPPEPLEAVFLEAAFFVAFAMFNRF